MSAEENQMDVVEEPQTEIKDETEVVEEQLSVHDALKLALRNSYYHCGLARGLKECVKALDRNEAQLCVLADSCDIPSYKEIVEALCKKNNIPMIRVEQGKELGEYVGLCRYDDEGNAVKVVSCSCAVIKRWGIESRARNVLLEHLNSQ